MVLLERSPSVEKIRYTDIATPKDFRSFLGENFSDCFPQRTTVGYAQELLDRLEEFPNRLQNSHYLQFAARTFLMAAEYQMWYLNKGHKDFHKKSDIQLDIMHPRSLLALGKHLANINIQQTAMKIAAKVPRDMGKYVWLNYIKPNGSIVSDTPELLHVVKERPRVRLGLPIYIPDDEFHRKVDAIPFSPQDADTMTEGEFNNNVLPHIERAFGGINVVSVFSDEQWRKVA